MQSAGAVRLAILALCLLAPALAVAKPRPRRPAPAPAPAPTPAPAPAPEPALPGAWRTTVEVELRKKPGERQAVVTKLAAGTSIEVLREEGRWLRVRVGAEIGYLTRTTVVDTTPVPAPIEPEPTPSTTPGGPRWSAARHHEAGTTGLVIGVIASAPLWSEAREGAERLGEVARGDQLAVLDATQPGWIQVRTSTGITAWIARGMVDDGRARIALVEDRTTTTTGVSASARSATSPRLEAPPARRRLAIRIDAELGYRSLAMDFTSNGTTGLANYVMSAEAAAASVEVEAVKRISARLFVGGDARVHTSTSAPSAGIAYEGPSRTGGSIPFSTVAGGAGLRAGLHARRVFDLAVRTGVHYDAFLTRHVANAGRLPREQLVGAVAGVRIEIAPPRSRVTVGLRFDALVLGARAQTTNLEDGEDSTARASWAGATLRVPVRRALAIQATYDFSRATTTWTGMSVRTPGTTAATRVDSTQTVWLGLAAEL